jgi:hypothetical protein
MNRKPCYVYLSILGSLILFLILSILINRESKVLDLSSEWIIFSLFPIIIGLFLGGYITKFKGLGIEIESAINEKIAPSIELVATEAIADIQGDEKRSINYLDNLSSEQKRSIKWLLFELGKSDYYSHIAVENYLRRLPNIEFFEVRTDTGNFVCYLPIEYFQNNNNYQSYDSEKIMQLIEAIENGNVIDQFPGIANPVFVLSDQKLVPVLKTLYEENIDQAAVISKRGRYLGVIFKRDVESKIAYSVLKITSV